MKFYRVFCRVHTNDGIESSEYGVKYFKSEKLALDYWVNLIEVNNVEFDVENISVYDDFKIYDLGDDVYVDIDELVMDDEL